MCWKASHCTGEALARSYDNIIGGSPPASLRIFWRRLGGSRWFSWLTKFLFIIRAKPLISWLSVVFPRWVKYRSSCGGEFAMVTVTCLICHRFFNAFFFSSQNGRATQAFAGISSTTGGRGSPSIGQLFLWILCSLYHILTFLLCCFYFCTR